MSSISCHFSLKPPFSFPSPLHVKKIPMPLMKKPIILKVSNEPSSFPPKSEDLVLKIQRDIMPPPCGSGIAVALAGSTLSSGMNSVSTILDVKSQFVKRAVYSVTVIPIILFCACCAWTKEQNRKKDQAQMAEPTEKN